MSSDLNDLGQPVGLPVSVSLPRPRPDGSRMQGRYCALVPLTLEHAQGLHDAFAEDSTGSIWTYLPVGPFASGATYADWVADAATWDDPMMHSILVDDQPVGHASFMRMDPAAGVIEVGFINYAPRLQRTRAATEAMALMMARVFDELGYRRYEWKCDALNTPSRAAAARLGFTYEGTFRQATVVKGRNRDTAWFSILDTEWPRLRAAFDAWLDPSNFDTTGQQIRSLTEIRTHVG